MTPEELLNPRYKVIADYPESPYKIGDIEFNDTWSDNDSLANYPSIFRKLKWWEERDIKDMPGYIRFYEPLPQRFKIGKVSKWEVGNQRCIVTSDVDIVRRELSIADLPATESEYNEYIKSKQAIEKM